MRKIVDVWLDARFVGTLGATFVVLLVSSAVLFMQVAASRTLTVHEAAVSCTVGEFSSSSERVHVQLSCATTTGVVNASMNHGATVLHLLQTRASHITCDVYVAGNVGNCVRVQSQHTH